MDDETQRLEDDMSRKSRAAKRARKRQELAEWRGFKSAKDMDSVIEVHTDSPTSKRKPSRVRHIS